MWGNENVCPHKNPYRSVHGSIIHQSPTVETTQMTISGWADKHSTFTQWNITQQEKRRMNNSFLMMNQSHAGEKPNVFSKSLPNWDVLFSSSIMLSLSLLARVPEHKEPHLWARLGLQSVRLVWCRQATSLSERQAVILHRCHWSFSWDG